MTTTDEAGWERFRSDLQTDLLAGVAEHVQRQVWNAEQIEAAQRDGLRRLLGHAVEHSPFHRRRLAGIDFDRAEPADLSRLPVMTKTEMMAALDDVFTDRRLTHDAVERALATTGTQPVTILDTYAALATGGASGRRGVFVFDRAAMTGFALSLARPLMARLAAMGGPPRVVCASPWSPPRRRSTPPAPPGR